jgi:hypothetical protein
VKKVYRKVKAKGHAQICLLDLKGATPSKSKRNFSKETAKLKGLL